MLEKEYYQCVLETVAQSIVVLDHDGTVNSVNPPTMQLWALDSAPAEGILLNNSSLAKRCPELVTRVEEARTRRCTVNFRCRLLVDDSREKVLSVRVRPVFAEDQSLAGTIIYAEGVTPREDIESTVAELESASQELQSANEELEKTTEELQSLNQELEKMNEELQARSEEIDQLNERYFETLERMPFPLMLLNERMTIEFWNSLAQKLFGFKEKRSAQVELEQLPIGEPARKLFKREHQNAIEKDDTVVINTETLGLRGYESANVHFTPVRQRPTKNVLVIVERGAGDGKGDSKSKAAASKKSNSDPAKKAARRGK